MTTEKDKSLCVFCASSEIVAQKYKDTAKEVGRLCAINGWRLLNGAGSEGLMGATTEGCQSHGGKVTGIIPKWMIDKGWLRPNLDELIVTDNMAQRKQALRDRSDAVLVLPGGMGTMEELFETTTQKQLGLYPKPVLLFNQDGFYDDLIRWRDTCYNQHFMRKGEDINLWTVINTPDEIFPILNKLLCNNKQASKTINKI